MKRLLLLTLISFLTIVPQLCSISFDEYRKQKGMPQVNENGVLNLLHKNLTDLTGLQDIENSVKDQITTLILSYNQLTTLPADIFNGFNNLQRLTLFGNKLTTLPAGIFNDLNNLQMLGLNNNQLVELAPGTFDGLNNLTHLQLQNNQLTSLPENIFNNLMRLSTLNLSGNPFPASFIPQLIEILHNIPNDNVSISLFDWPAMPKHEVIKRLTLTLHPKFLEKVPLNIREYYNIKP